MRPPETADWGSVYLCQQTHGLKLPWSWRQTNNGLNPILAAQTLIAPAQCTNQAPSLGQLPGKAVASFSRSSSACAAVRPHSGGFTLHFGHAQSSKHSKDKSPVNHFFVNSLMRVSRFFVPRNVVASVEVMWPEQSDNFLVSFGPRAGRSVRTINKIQRMVDMDRHGTLQSLVNNKGLLSLVGRG